MILDSKLPLSLTGGEPFAQPEDVAGLLARLRVQRPDLHVIVYSGFVLEDILEMSEAIPAMRGILDLADVLVDGPYIPDLNHDWVQWRGSANQRPIDLRASVFTGTVHCLVELDWRSGQVITVTGEGDLVGTAGAMRELFGGEDLEASRMCGQATEVHR
jgi:organic radical activating enzyme